MQAVQTEVTMSTLLSLSRLLRWRDSQPLLVEREGRASVNCQIKVLLCLTSNFVGAGRGPVITGTSLSIMQLVDTQGVSSNSVLGREFRFSLILTASGVLVTVFAQSQHFVKSSYSLLMLRA